MERQFLSLTSTLLVVVATCALLRLPYVDETFLNVDEAGYAVTASEWLQGSVPYVGSVEQKPPGIFALYALVFRLTGRRMEPVHRVALLWVAATAMVLYFIGERVAGARAGALAAVGYSLFSSTFQPYDSQAANTELFMVLPTSLAVWLVLLSKGKSSPAVAFAAGALAGISVTFKQVAAFDVAVIGAFLLFRGAADAANTSGARFRVVPRTVHRTGQFAAFLLGVTLVLAAMLAYFASSHSLDDLVRWAIVFPLRYSGSMSLSWFLGLGLRETLWCATPAFALWALGVAGAVQIVSLAKAKRIDGTRNLLILPCWLLSAGLGTAAGGRFFQHYYFQLLPPLVLLASWMACKLETSLKDSDVFPSWRIARNAGLALAIAVAMNWAGCFQNRFFIRLGNSIIRRESEGLNLMGADEAARATGRLIRERTKTEDRVFVWGFLPEVYYYAQRRPASRFTNCNFITGVYPGSPPPSAFSASEPIGDSLRILLADLKRNPPVYFVDTSTLPVARYRFSYEYHPVTRYPALHRWLKRQYQIECDVDGLRLWRRTTT